MANKTFNRLGQRIFIAVLIVLILYPAQRAYCAETAVFKGRVLDVDGAPVAEAEIYVYDSEDTRRPADFISARTNSEGRFYMKLPANKYWAVARLRKGEKYGPLMPGDRHSGEPVEFETEAGEELVMDFVIADIRETARLAKKTAPGLTKIQGRTIDRSGTPVKMVYVFANSSDAPKEIPDFMSGWTDESGEFTLYLPAGEYFIGYAKTFPAGPESGIYRQIAVGPERMSIEIVTIP